VVDIGTEGTGGTSFGTWAEVGLIPMDT